MSKNTSSKPTFNQASGMRKIVMFWTVCCFSVPHTSNGFTITKHTTATRRCRGRGDTDRRDGSSSTATVGGWSRTSSCLSAFTEEISDFYLNYPVQSAILTCGVKASLADGIAQYKETVALSKDEFGIELRRNVAYIIYGGIFIGFACHLEYDILFPLLFGYENGLMTIVEKVIFDDFVSAPLFWLPPAYLIKALVYEHSLQDGLQKYFEDIRHNSLLRKYWTVWIPAQSISFSVIPDHLRVAWMASVSFFWFIILSTIASKNDGDNSM
mmetsp:Transcript_53205/g.64135  ORF Transcript_53205/g.64135 Transcript_53205/m.64135 type:complete len:269 (-) Transcript_53205:198-1004(-)